MKVSELFRRLSIGELSNLAIGTDGAGEIVEAKKPAVILHANNALERMFTRLVLREERMKIRTYLGRDTYPLRTEFAVSGGAVGAFILDSTLAPFPGDLVKVLQIRNEKEAEVPLNEEGNTWSFWTPNPDTLILPREYDEQIFSIVYQAKHLDLVDNDEDQEIMLPEFLEPALTAYIASEIYGIMNTKEAVMTAAGHRNRFEELMKEAEFSDVFSTSKTGRHGRFDARGFV